MDLQIENIKEIAKQQRDLAVWEKFENNPEDFAKLKMEPPPKMNASPLWMTQNSEYGRFLLKNRGYPQQKAESATIQELRQESAKHEPTPPQSAGGESYLSEKDAEIEEATKKPEVFNTDERCETGVRTLLPIDPKYMAASRRGNRPVNDNTSTDADKEGANQQNRLTTGYAKQWMSSERGRFWDNIQEVAPLAGFDVPSGGTRGNTSYSSSTDTQVLKVE